MNTAFKYFMFQECVSTTNLDKNFNPSCCISDSEEMILEIIDKVRTVECNYTNYDLISKEGST